MKMTFKQKATSFAIKQAINYVYKNPENLDKNLNNIVNLVEKIAVKESHKNGVKMFKKILADPDNNWNVMIHKIVKEIHPNVLKKFTYNYFVNAGVVGIPRSAEVAKENDCNVPWTIIIDPTSACNLKCKGCWASEYDKTSSLSNELIDRIITEGKEMGIHFYIYTGGEPLVRKKDLLWLAEKHNDCIFLAFTNGTLIDEAFAKELQRVGNFFFAISVEGFEKENDMRRGKGVYKKVLKAMDILKEHGIGFGYSTCYHSKNVDVVTSDEYIDLMIEKGCRYGWYFSFMPVGTGSPVELMTSADKREYMVRRFEKLRQEKPLFLIDFMHDGRYVGGCVAGGRNFFHINPNGDVEPCVFIHYSNANIKNCTLLEALKSPIFKEYRKGQPFNNNHLRPCPLLDNPHLIREMVNRCGAKSTQLMDNETVEAVSAKCEYQASKWATAGDRVWEELKAEGKVKKENKEDKATV